MTDILKKWSVFLPLLIIYLFLTLFLSKDNLQGDERRYISFSENIINGYYANRDLKPGFLWNGPGYPIILTPFTFFKSSLIYPKILNSLFLFFGVIFIYKCLRFKLNHKISVFLSYISGITHPFFIFSISSILTESLSFFLVSVSLFYFIKVFETNKKIDLFIFSISSGFLILTKVFFSYVFLVCGVVSCVFYIIYQKKRNLNYLIKLSFYPFIICIPYIFYTYSLTNKIFYWSDAGGSILYSMSTPFKNEYGDWFQASENLGGLKNSKTTFYKKNNLRENHSEFLKSLSGLNGVEKDQRLKKKAIENITSNKIKYLKNIVSNFGRISIRYPFTNRQVYPLFLIIFICHFSILMLPLILSIKKILSNLIYEKIIILTFFSVFLAETLLLSADSRFIFPTYPIIIYLISNIFINEKTINNNSCIK
ncbi:MAG: hypothetical protein P8M60_08675 [Flavobacteriaceae bacterium]|nr:hypothetical protein [Flavobacteriaceae bacterium]